MRMKKRAMRNCLPVAAMVVFTVGGGANAADIFNGKEVYDLHCQGCHGVDATMKVSTHSGDIDDFFVSLDGMPERLRDGMGHIPSYRGMIEDSDLRDVIAYVRTLQR